MEVADVLAEARRRHGVELSVVRLLAAQSPRPHGGAVTYLAQLAAPAPTGLRVTPVAVDDAPQPHRAAYAEPGGPAATLRWAARALRERGHGEIVSAAQVRTWNLSAIWRLETTRGAVWLKHVPGFYRHEATVLDLVARRGFAALVPAVVAADDAGRMLLAEVPGADLYGAGADVREGIAADVHRLQEAFAGDVGALLRAGVPDGRAGALAAAVARLAGSPAADGLTGLPDLVAGLPDRLAELAACGVPDTLVHGDLHPGNARGHDSRRVVLDWCDAFVGHPAFDLLRLVEGLPADAASAIVDGWVGRWRRAVPGSDPGRAVDLLRPVAPLRAAAVNASFVANIEPVERAHHADDVRTLLRQAVAAQDTATA
jgi:hypothetical protein